MMKNPRDPASKTAPPQPEARQPERAATSPHPEAPATRSAPKPKVLMGEVATTRAEHFGQQRFLLRSFMQNRGLRPSEWARSAGIPSGELLGFLTGKSRTIPTASLEKLAAAARCKVEDFFK